MKSLENGKGPPPIPLLRKGLLAMGYLHHLTSCPNSKFLTGRVQRTPEIAAVVFWGCFFFFSFFRATPAIHGSSQVRGQIGASAASLSNTTRSLTHYVRPGIEPTSYPHSR